MAFAPSAGGPSGVVSACVCGDFNGNIVRFYQCRSRRPTFPFTCMLGPDWPCLICTYLIIAIPGFSFAAFVAPVLGTVAVIMMVLAVVWTLGSLTLTACSDPGVVYRNDFVSSSGHRGSDAEEGPLATTDVNQEQTTICASCQIRRGPDVHHCADCNSCVMDLDHHCPWTGKCIGKYNMPYFKCFLGSVVMCFAALCIIGFMIISEGKRA